MQPTHRKRGDHRTHSALEQHVPVQDIQKLWPEAEVNVTHFYGGNNKIVPTSQPGKTLVYLTPGMVILAFCKPVACAR